ncbi:MAG: acyl-CoA dehydrogenase family protein, partial [Chitinophagaceae bacterium]
MNIAFTDQQKKIRVQVANYVNREVIPFANNWDKAESIPTEAIRKLASEGYLGATLPAKYKGLEMDQVSYGILQEEIGRGCSSLRSLVTVHSSLVAETILRWGTETQKHYWLPLLATGAKLAAFCLSEPNVGSDAKNITTAYHEQNDQAVINGVKKWITFGQIADVYLVLAKNAEGESAFLVERNIPGIEVKPLNGMLGTKAS